MIKSTDIKISDFLYVSMDCVYNKRRRHNSRDTCSIIYRVFEKYRKYLDFPKDTVVRVCAIKGHVSGRYWSGDNVCEISCSMHWQSLLEVLAHELVHAEQYHTGRLKKEWVRNKGWVHKWDGSINHSKGSTYNAYRNQPWEKEAWERQTEIAELVSKDMEDEFDK